MKKILLFGFLFCLTGIVFSQHELWGTVSNGGNFGHGYIFKSDSVGNNLVIMHHFDSINGSNPGALLAVSNNKLYGLTSAGGHNGGGLFSSGTFFEYDMTTSVFTVHQHFGPSNTEIWGYKPAGDGLRTLTEVSPGLIYGQIRGDYTGGVVFSFNTTTEETSVALNIPTFMGGTWNTTQGNWLVGNLHLAEDGYLYGTTHQNSQCPIPNPQLGSIIRINPTTNAYSVSYLCPCSGANGYQFDNHFVTHDNKLYSVTKVGGASDDGVIYSFDPATNMFTNEYNFEGDTFGFHPSTMVKMPNGKFYGTSDGGTPEPFFPYGCGMLYEFDPATDQFSKKLDFTYGTGWYMEVGPFAFSLIDGTNGKLYGVNQNGIFEYDIDLNQTTAAGRFPIGMGWYQASTPSLTAVCRKPSHTLLADSSISVCTGTDIAFDLQSDNTTTYTWTQNGIPIGSQTTGTLTLPNSATTDNGTWICEMTNVCGTTMSPAIDINVTPTVTAVITSIDFELHATPADEYQWLDCDNAYAPVGAETDQAFAPLNNGSYAVVVTSGMCVDTSDCFAVTGLGLQNAEAPADLYIFPNPAGNTIQFTPKDGTAIESVTIMNASGQIVLQGKTTVLDITTLAPGSYFVVVKAASGNWQGKFVKENP